MIKYKKTGLVFFLAIFFSVFSIYFIKSVWAANLTSASISLSDSRPAQTANYTFQFSGATNTNIKCAEIIFATTATGVTVPTGLGTSAAGVAVNASSNFVSGISAWTLTKSTNGTLKITNASGGNAVGSTGTITIDGITNGSTNDTTYYTRFTTYSDEACTSSVDSSTNAYVYTNGQILSLTVDPSLTFSIANVGVGQTVNGVPTTVATSTDTVPLGTVTQNANAVAAQDLQVETNAGNGYTVYIRYTAAPTNGSESIDDISGTNASPAAFSGAGTEAFGYTTESTSLSGSASRFSSNKWAKFTTSNAEVAHSTSPTSSTEITRIGYQAGISGSTPAGSYTTTIIITATPTY